MQRQEIAAGRLAPSIESESRHFRIADLCALSVDPAQTRNVGNGFDVEYENGCHGYKARLTRTILACRIPTRENTGNGAPSSSFRCASPAWHSVKIWRSCGAASDWIERGHRQYVR